MRLRHALIATLVVAASPAGYAHAITTWECAGSAWFENTCENKQVAYFRICKGLNGSEGKAALKVQPGGSTAEKSYPRYTTYLDGCGTPPSDACPSAYPLTLTKCD